MHIVIPIAIVAGCGIAIGVVWLGFGRFISRMGDRFIPGRASDQPIDPMSIKFDPAGVSSSFTIGSWNWPLSWAWPPWPFELQVIFTPQGRLVLCAAGRSFTFGPVQERWTDRDKVTYRFASDAGDVVSFTRQISRLPWPTPFTFNVLGGSVPKWKRYAYDRFRWRKTSGAMLEITWTDEYWFYRRSGWSDTCNNRLASVSIRPGPIEEAATIYLRANKGWNGNEYRLETQPATSGEEMVAAIYLKDEAAAAPGAGKSVILRVNKLSKKVVSETGWQ